MRRLSLINRNISRFPNLRSMATVNRVQLAVGEWPEYSRSGITQDQANIASELLQENHERHHIFFNKEGFHNHIAHHLLTIWALKASPDAIRKGYELNKP